MEGLKVSSPLPRLIQRVLAEDKFTLIDIGCSSGIDDVWRVFSESLRAFAFDPNLDEIARLSKHETLPGISYIPGFVGLPPGDSGVERLRSGEYWARTPWRRLSSAQTLERRAARGLSNQRATDLNLWKKVRLADPARPIILSSFLDEHKVHDVDFIKIDVDGPDFLILRSLADVLYGRNVIGVGIEVNYFGSDDPDIHTFHNVDRFMRKHGFDLFALSTRPYSVAALPARYQLSVPAQTEFGRPLQGDAIYLRDAASSEHAAWSARLEPRKLLKLAALFSLAQLPDCAAEVLVTFRDRLHDSFNVDAALDVLTRFARSSDDMPASYLDYMAEFKADAPSFYPQSNPSNDEPSERVAAPAAELHSVTILADDTARSAPVENDRLRDGLRAVYASASRNFSAPLRWFGHREQRSQQHNTQTDLHNDTELEPAIASGIPLDVREGGWPGAPGAGHQPAAAKYSPFDVFHSAEAQSINRARLEHLTTLDLDLMNKRVLEVGAGIGLHTEFFEQRGCDVLSTDGAPANVAEMIRRWPHRRIGMLDLDAPGDLRTLGLFDIIYAYGTLYHLRDPDGALSRLAKICSGIILLETVVSRGNFPENHLVHEPPILNQAVSGTGCRPTRAWIMAALKRHFGQAYTTLDQPAHPDFITDWTVIGHQGNLRAVFVGARHSISASSLTEILPTRHRNHQSDRRPRNARVLIDVGAYRGDHSLGLAENDPGLTVHAFEPLPGRAAALMNSPANYHLHAMAVAEHDGVAELRVNRFDAASSLLPIDQAARKMWTGGDDLEEERAVLVSTTRLDTFMRNQGITRVEMLKVDAQGTDLCVVRSAGDFLPLIECIQMEVTVTPSQLYVGAANKRAVMAFMEERGFQLRKTISQSYGQEENLIFRRAEVDCADDRMSGSAVEDLVPELYELTRAKIAYGDCQLDNGDLVFRTDEQPWFYTALVPPGLVQGRPDADRAEVVLSVLVEEGLVEVGILYPDEKTFHARETVRESKAEQMVTLMTPCLGRTGPLVLRNAGEAGESRGRLRLVKIRRHSDHAAEVADTSSAGISSDALGSWFVDTAGQLARLADTNPDDRECIAAHVAAAGHQLRNLLARAGFALTEVRPRTIAPLFAQLDNLTLAKLASSFAVLHPLKPFPSWRFDSFREDSDLATYVRYAIWLASGDRPDRTSVVVPWHGDTKIELHFGTDLSLQAFVAGRFEPNEFALLAKILQPGMRTIDGGANDGLYTLFMAARVGPKGRVLSIEPSPRELERLRRNLDLNTMPQVELVPAALAESPGELTLLIADETHAGQNTLGAFMYPDTFDVGRCTIEATTVDELVRSHGYQGVDVIKLDLEGAELRALTAGQTTLSSYHPLLLLEAVDTALRHQGGSLAMLRSLLLECGYLLFHFDPATGEPVPLEGEMSSETLIAVHPARPFGFPIR